MHSTLSLEKGPSARSIRIDLPKFTLIGATTRAGQLTAPLRDRFGVLFRLELYSPEQLSEIILRSAGILEIPATVRARWSLRAAPEERRVSRTVC